MECKMPKGVPNAGFRKTRRWREAHERYGFGGEPVHISPPRVEHREKMRDNVVHFMPHTSPESDEQIANRLNERFDIMETLVHSCIKGTSRALVISGPAGLGKSFTVENALHNWDASGKNYAIVKGYVRATGLIKKLYQYRNAGQVIVFDDADSIFFDDTSLNIIKAVCDTTEKRKVSWLSEGKLVDEDGATTIPRTFTFNGSVIFLTNYDFDEMINRGHKLTPHFQALMSRAHYVDLTLKSKRDYIVRIFQVAQRGMFRDMSERESDDVLQFILDNTDRLRELSLRMAIKIANIRKTTPNTWQKIAQVTCCR
jgi:hypothetical protein